MPHLINHERKDTMKTTSMKMLIAFALSISAVSAVNAAPADFKTPLTIAHHQGGTDPFPPSTEAIPDTRSVIASHQGGTDPFPPSTDAIPDTRSVIASHQGGTDPFPPSTEAIPDTRSVIASHQGGTDPFPPSEPEAGVIA
jgi:hypothetical protein